MSTPAKYNFTGKTKTFHGATVCQIIAVIDISDTVKKGTVGGWIETSNNLSTFGRCWIGDDAVVMDKARVTGGAQVFNRAIVKGRAGVTDSARIFGNSKIEDAALIDGNSQIFGNAFVYGSTMVRGHAMIFDDACVSDNTMIKDHAMIFENASISGTARVGGTTQVSGGAIIRQGQHYEAHIIRGAQTRYCY